MCVYKTSFDVSSSETSPCRLRLSIKSAASVSASEIVFIRPVGVLSFHSEPESMRASLLLGQPIVMLISFVDHEHFHFCNHSLSVIR
jgi:hypothetical protein